MIGWPDYAFVCSEIQRRYYEFLAILAGDQDHWYGKLEILPHAAQNFDGRDVRRHVSYNQNVKAHIVDSLQKFCRSLVPMSGVSGLQQGAEQGEQLCRIAAEHGQPHAHSRSRNSNAMGCGGELLTKNWDVVCRRICMTYRMLAPVVRRASIPLHTYTVYERKWIVIYSQNEYVRVAKRKAMQMNASLSAEAQRRRRWNLDEDEPERLRGRSAPTAIARLN